MGTREDDQNGLRRWDRLWRRRMEGGYIFIVVLKSSG